MSTSRRGFLKGLAGAGAGAAAVGAMPACAPRIDPAPVLDVEAPVNGKLDLRVPRYPDLSVEGGAVTLRIPGRDNVLVVHPSGNTYAVMDATCTHVGCPLGFVEGDVVCPCHASRFDLKGQVIQEPAKVNLQTYSATYNTATETLTIDFAAGQAGFPSVVNGQLVLPFSQFPELKTPGGVVSGVPQGYGKKLFIFAEDDGSYLGVDSICTHQSCAVNYDASAKGLLCPCHGSAFDKRGQVTNPPATRPLKTFTATADANGVTVQIA